MFNCMKIKWPKFLYDVYHILACLATSVYKTENDTANKVMLIQLATISFF